ncbi:MAG: PD-(D/E)XK nuclease family protein [Alphaproteobacteria bacterium]|nr:PD-(D/E)XK nuclease family protein [Alphaproteobacteria bacterium]
MNSRRIYNIRCTDSFVDVLARRFLQEYANNAEELSNVLFLLPNRRACRELADAFVRANAMVPTILPQMVPIADAQEDEILLSGQGDLARQLPPAVSASERLLRLTKQILQHDERLGVKQISSSQAYELAQNLAKLLDEAIQHNLSLDKLDTLLENSLSYAEHWQRTLNLLTVIREIWPQELQKQQKIDSVERQKQLLAAELEYWRQTKTTQRIVVAGTTAAFPQLKELVRTVSDLPNGEVWLYGLDTYLSDADWQQVGVSHPQYELKELLDYLHISRTEVQNVTPLTKTEIFVSECMRPASTTDKWSILSSSDKLQAFSPNIKIVAAEDMRQEALAIALIIRHTLETPDKTAALITSDRNLARRVVSELKRWNIVADDSAGQPLSLTPIGTYLRLIADVLENGFSEISRLNLLKHPLTSCGLEKQQCNKLARRIELYWRGSRKMQDGFGEKEKNLLENLRLRLQPLSDLYAKNKVSLKDLLMAHIAVAESLADTPEKSGDKIIWRKDDGQTAADFVAEQIANAEILNTVTPREYGNLLTKMLQTQNVRVRYGMHPRVKILGPIEARLTQFDVTIIGEANEGFWPQQPPADMWMSRQMRVAFGLPDSERSVGVSAADFAHLLCAPKVYITRAERADGTPTTKSRWLLRLEAVLTALLGQNEKKYDFYDCYYEALAKFGERAQKVTGISAPMPCPPLQMRPLKLSASNVNFLLRDPYTVFAKYILQLYPLDKLDRNFDRRDYGNFVHRTIELFNRQYGAQMPQNAKDELLRIGAEQFEQAHVPTEVRVFWWPKFEQTTDWLLKVEQQYRVGIKEIYNEVEGQMKLPLSDGREFIITGKADRIDVTDSGAINIIDYKTGSSGYPNSQKDFKLGYEPQLPVEALIALNGGYKDLSVFSNIGSLQFWKLGSATMSLNEEDSTNAVKITKANLEQRLQEYYQATPPAPYVYKPDGNAQKYSDYEHLARYLEWGIKEEGEVL